MAFCVQIRGFSSCTRQASSQGNQRHYGMLKNNHLEVEGLLFYGKKGGSRWAHFTASFPTPCMMWGQSWLCPHWENTPHSTCRLCRRDKWCQPVGKKKKKGSCTKSEKGQVLLALHLQLEEPYQQLFSRPQWQSNNILMHLEKRKTCSHSLRHREASGSAILR